jgi:HAD superfamily hydrolase (TIGR01450 family)
MMPEINTNHSTRLTAQTTASLLDRIDTILFDCDGVIWRGNHIIPNALATLKRLRRLNKRFFFITNNSTKSRANMKQKFTTLGLDVDLEEIIGSAFLLASYLKKGTLGDVYVIGRSGIIDELNAAGIFSFGGPVQ